MNKLVLAALLGVASAETINAPEDALFFNEDLN